MNKIEEKLELIPGTIAFWEQQVMILEKKDTIFRAADFDYTLFSRDEQLKKEEIFRNNRGNAAPSMYLESEKMTDIIQKYYLDKKMPQDILSKLNPEIDIIITAGIYEFQIGKLNILPELNNFTKIITKDGAQKIPELIRYIIFELKYIPSEIIVYEDRPQFFVEYRDLIEQTLGTKLTIIKVEMDGNDGYESIEAI